LHVLYAVNIRGYLTLQRETIVVGLGEVLWDLLPSGPRFGGAPANFACSVAELSAATTSVYMLSSVGHDELGRQALESLEQHRVHSKYTSQTSFPTGTVEVHLSEQGIASYQFAENTAWDHLSWSTALSELATRTDAVCFGTLGQRSATSQATILRFLEETTSSALRVFDVNLRSPFYSDEIIRHSLERSNVLKLNDEELPTVAELCGLSGSPESLLRQLAEHYQLLAVALTRGPQGALLLRGSEIDDNPGLSAKVADTIGAGDAYTAALVLGILDDQPTTSINQLGCRVAAYVCEQSGATPRIPREISII